jgi:hypothetical protein
MGSIGRQATAIRAFAAIVATAIVAAGAHGQMAGESPLSRGTVFYRRGQHDQAIVELTESIRLNPSSAEAYFRRGMAFGRRSVNSRGPSPTLPKSFACSPQMGWLSPPGPTF